MIQLLTVESDRVAGTIASYEVDRKVNNTRTADPTDQPSSNLSTRSGADDISYGTGERLI